MISSHSFSWHISLEKKRKKKKEKFAPVLSLSVRLHSRTCVTLLDSGGYGGYGGGFYPGAGQKAAKRGRAVDWKCLISQPLH